MRYLQNFIAGTQIRNIEFIHEKSSLHLLPPTVVNFKYRNIIYKLDRWFYIINLIGMVKLELKKYIFVYTKVSLTTVP